jgi:redox-sensitive bicupin YhaK (pirin superfamily)
MLSPFYQSIREIEAILADPRLSRYVVGPIEEITKEDAGWNVEGAEGVAHVRVCYGRPSHPGPVPFELQFEDPMIEVRNSSERGATENEWLQSYHTFSFGDYYDPNYTGFGPLRVLNEDVVAPGKGFEPHPHQNMEILTYVLSGQLQHEDSLGQKTVLKAGDFQLLSAGTGVLHSEVNPSEEEKVHFLQIWVAPEKKGGEPFYQQLSMPKKMRKNKLVTIVSPDGPLKIGQNVVIQACFLGRSRPILIDVKKGWIQVTSGEITLGDRVLKAGDGASLFDEQTEVRSKHVRSEFLLFIL